MLRVESYTIYHSPNAYLGSVMAERRLRGLPVSVERRPIYIPRDRGPKVADLVGSRETTALTSYHREDCARWARRHLIPIRFTDPETFEQRAKRWLELPLEREELPARAYYAALGSGHEAELDQALFRAAFVECADVNEESVVRAAAEAAGLDPDPLLQRALEPSMRTHLERALADFEGHACPGVPTWVLDGERFWGKDRLDELAERIEELAHRGARS